MSIRTYSWRALDDAQRLALLRRPAVNDDKRVREGAAKIVLQVREGGDRALRELTARYDGAELESLRVSEREVADATRSLPASAVDAIDVAIANVTGFHEAQLPSPIKVETMPGVVCERVSHAIDAVGLYVPAGTAPRITRSAPTSSGSPICRT